MWSIGQVKFLGKTSFKRAYWLCVLVGVITGVASSSSGAGVGTSGWDDLPQAQMQINQLLQQGASHLGVTVSVLLAMIFAVVGFVIIIASLLDIFLFAPIRIGCCGFFLRNLRQDTAFDAIFDGFRRNYIRNVGAMFLSNLCIILGSICFVIPGIVLGYSFRLLPYILLENPTMSITEAMGESRRRMKGHKGHAFGLDLSFLGWILLSVLTLGILSVFYVRPYMQATDAALYQVISYPNMQGVSMPKSDIPSTKETLGSTEYVKKEK